MMEQHEIKKHKRLTNSFKDAIYGFLIAVRLERNLRFQLFAGLCVLLFSIIIKVRWTEILIILVLIGGVVSLELVNTAVERLVDLVTRKPHPMARAAKDTAAAAVWWFSMIAALIYILILVDTLL
ncbi:diacylglycerol kinase family protein [Sporolactobacillus sp. THM7-4]|nr:diacylglycerol kinase family protein [Sporolactobacillus sp. THM7-4]